MLLRVTLALVAMAVSAMVSARFIIEVPVAAGAAGSATLALAPISLGNPAAAATLQVRRPSTPDEPVVGKVPPYSHTMRAHKGDTLSAMLVRVGIDRKEAAGAIAALRKHYNPRHIRAGQEITLTFQPEPHGLAIGRFLGLTLVPDFKRKVTVERAADGGFRAAEVERVLIRSLARAAGTIENSLFEAGDQADLPMPVLVKLIRAFSWDVDFQRDLQPGDTFEVMYERVTDKDGTVVHTGDIRLAALTLSGKRTVIYRHTTRDGHTDYFDAMGQSVRRALLRTPVDGARLSSRYGKRRHPILGFTKMHRGIDFAAPTGTPIYAAGNGTVERAGRYGAYGKYVRVRHNDEYATAYAHLSGYAKAVRRGARIKQGEVIGYVGTTGRSTGPHLHYEILRGGRQVNPLRVKMPSGRKLRGKDLEDFKTAMADVKARYAALGTEMTVAAGKP